ncbi:MAG: hypothetical protein M3R21_00665 [Candidatus Dormibacteraeota bacterium]|nr:hypothetical protein [Candidatus Dormibacteraeota bacterium]
MTSLFSRLGMAGAILLASALIFAAIAGGVVVQRLHATPAVSQQHRVGEVNDQGHGDAENKNADSSTDKADVQDKDT